MIDGGGLIQIAAGAVSIGGGIAWLTWFIAEQFRKNRELFYRVISLHNHEDDDRFEELYDAVWNLRARAAVKDGTPIPERKSPPRRRYLGEAQHNGSAQ